MRINKTCVSFTHSEVIKIINLAKEASVIDNYSDGAESTLQAILKLEDLLPATN